MRILAFETSCDDTSVALFDGPRLVAMDTRSQAEHSATGGVVPEVAARLHANSVFDALDAVFAKAGRSLGDVDLFACTEKPGLVPSLLVGKTVARALARLRGKPLRWVDHVEAHMYALWLDRDPSDVKLPAVCLTASGGHNEIYYLPAPHVFERVGATRDDSAGEAFDKVSVLLGMGYPGGPAVERMAKNFPGSLRGIFPRSMLDAGSLDFSFSGLKSAVRREAEKRSAAAPLADADRAEICAEFQAAVTDVLCAKLFLAAEKFGAESVMLAGGVAANGAYRAAAEAGAKARGISLLWPAKLAYCGDNAAMVGMAAWLAETVPGKA